MLKLFFDIVHLKMTTPTLYGWFHVLCVLLTIGATVLLCFLYKRGYIKNVSRVVLITAIFVMALEIYKQFQYSFSYDGGVQFDYQWYAFPWQFCSMPMYVGLIAGLTRGKLQSFLYSFLATFAVFAGLCVMIYPGDVFTSSVWINIQSMICHGSMVVIGVFLYYTGAVKIEHKTILKAMAVFSVAVGMAVILNELAVVVGIMPGEIFNMFFVSRHCEPSLPVYSSVQAVVPYPWCLFIYIAGFTAASYILLLLAMLGKWIENTVKSKPSRVKTA